MATHVYTELKEAGCKLDNHESDLYVLDTPEARSIIRQYPLLRPCHFKDKDGKQWIELPFMHLPFWEARQEKSTGDTSRTES